MREVLSERDGTLGGRPSMSLGLETISIEGDSCLAPKQELNLRRS